LREDGGYIRYFIVKTKTQDNKKAHKRHKSQRRANCIIVCLEKKAQVTILKQTKKNGERNIKKDRARERERDDQN
jgi:hypothetical protein